MDLSYSMEGTAICRICHEDGCTEQLISPCNCTGTVGMVHLSCVEKWLGMTRTDCCEICNYQFSTKSKPKPFIEWVRHSPHSTDRRVQLTDLTCFLVLTPLAAVSVWLCVVGAVHFLHTSTSSWEMVGMISLSVLLILIYLIWFTVALRYHLRGFLDWRKTNHVVKLLSVSPALCNASTQTTDGAEAAGASVAATNTDINNNVQQPTVEADHSLQLTLNPTGHMFTTGLTRLVACPDYRDPGGLEVSVAEVGSRGQYLCAVSRNSAVPSTRVAWKDTTTPQSSFGAQVHCGCCHHHWEPNSDMMKSSVHHAHRPSCNRSQVTSVCSDYYQPSCESERKEIKAIAEFNGKKESTGYKSWNINKCSHEHTTLVPTDRPGVRERNHGYITTTNPLDNSKLSRYNHGHTTLTRRRSFSDSTVLAFSRHYRYYRPGSSQPDIEQETRL